MVLGLVCLMGSQLVLMTSSSCCCPTPTSSTGLKSRWGSPPTSSESSEAFSQACASHVGVLSSPVVALAPLLQLQVSLWCFFTSIFLCRFMMLGSKINTTYHSTSLLLTEQLNLYLRCVSAPHKKERLTMSNQVLKIAAKLLKKYIVRIKSQD